MQTKIIGAIIKHQFRDYDVRIDVYKVPEEATHEEIQTAIEKKMIGLFVVVAITHKVSITTDTILECLTIPEAPVSDIDIREFHQMD